MSARPRGPLDGSSSSGPRASGLVDEDSLRAIHEAHAGPLYVFALRSLGDPEAAADVVQETLVRAWRRADQFDPERGALRNWLFGITRNLIIDRHRTRRREDLDGELPEMVDLRGAEAIDRALEGWQVAEALRRLSDHHRAAIVETYYRGHTVTEAATRLGVPPGTVKSRLYYGLRALRLILEEMGIVR